MSEEEFSTEKRFSDSDTPNHWALIRYLSAYLWPKKRWDLRARVIIASFFLLIAQLVNLFVPYFFKLSVDALTPSNTQLTVPVALIIAYGVGRILRHVFAQIRDVIFVTVSQRAQRRIGLQVFTHLHKLSLAFHLSRKTGGLSRVIERGTAGIHFVLSATLFHVLPTLIEILLVTGFLWWYSGISYAIICLLMVVAYVGYTTLITNERLRVQRQRNKNDSLASSRAIDSLINYETVKYFNNEELESMRYDSALASYEKSVIRSETLLGALNAGQGLIVGIGLILVMWLAAQDVVQGTGTVGDFVMVNTYLIQLYVPLHFMGWVYREMRQGLTDMEKLRTLGQIAPDITDKEGAKPLPNTSPSIVFSNVCFHYQPEKQVLNNISFSIKNGEKVAVVGPTGSGKSTLTRLIYRFYEPSSGSILINGQLIDQTTQKSIRKAIGIVPQDTVLFNESIAYNLRYGRWDATQEEIEQAAKKAQIHSFITSLPKGYDTVVGERGLKLSGGEKQRIAIARAIIKDPEIMIFDEATSALDSKTEKHIQAALNAAAKDHPTLVIAHRLATIVDADQILVLNKGEIMESGTHQELLAQNGLYRDMWDRQSE